MSSASVQSLSGPDLLPHLSGHPLTLVKFGAPWCGPCKAIAPLLERLAADHPAVSFVEIDIDQAPDLAARFAIRSIPTLIAWKGNELQWTKIGVPSSKDLSSALSDLAS
jgi:thioredoxin